MKTTFPKTVALIRAIENGSADRVLAAAKDPATFTRHAEALDFLEERARDVMSRPVPPLVWSKLRMFAESGDRATYEADYFVRRQLLGDLTVLLAAGREGEGGEYVAAMEDLLWAICDEYTWALPAHLLRWDKAGVDGNRADRITLDLFASETGLHIAEALHFLGDRLSPRLVARCRAEIRERILDSYLGPYNHCWWELGRNNWGAVCAGAIGCTFLYEERNIERLKTALPRILDTMECYIDSFPEDGTCEEGPGYWNYGFGFFTVFAAALFDYTAGAVDLFANPDVRKIARFPERVRLSARRVASFSDGDRFCGVSPGTMGELHRRYPDAVKFHPVPGGSRNYRCCLLLRDFVWSDPAGEGDSAGRATLPDAVEHFEEAQWLVVRREPFGFAALFGHNGVSHNHNDVGSFLLVHGDEEGPMDLGTGLYRRQYFGPERYTDEILCCGSQGHSVPIVGGQCQRAGREFGAKDVRFGRRGDGADETLEFEGDIAGAYAVEGLKALRRAFAVRPAAGVVTLRDEAEFSGAALPLTERFVGYAKPEILGPGEVRFGVFAMRHDPALVPTIGERPFVMHATKEKTTVYLLDFALPAGTTVFECRFEPVAK